MSIDLEKVDLMGRINSLEILGTRYATRIRELEAALAAEKENAARGWELFQIFRRKYAELKYPGMTGEIKLMNDAALAPKEPK